MVFLPYWIFLLGGRYGVYSSLMVLRLKGIIYIYMSLFLLSICFGFSVSWCFISFSYVLWSRSVCVLRLVPLFFFCFFCFLVTGFEPVLNWFTNWFTDMNWYTQTSKPKLNFKSGVVQNGMVIVPRTPLVLLLIFYIDVQIWCTSLLSFSTWLDASQTLPRRRGEFVHNSTYREKEVTYSFQTGFTTAIAVDTINIALNFLSLSQFKILMQFYTKSCIEINLPYHQYRSGNQSCG